MNKIKIKKLILCFFISEVTYRYLKKTSALSPTVELGAQWPPMGIEPVNPFELPLLNTVERVYISIWD